MSSGLMRSSGLRSRADRAPARQEHADAEAGFMLLAVVVMVALVMIALAVAAPVVAKDLRRDKEVESERRSEDYVRAIQLYYAKFKSYPPSMDALEKSNNVRYLRREWVDPLTGKSDWRILHLGEQKTTVKGFFGEPLGGLNTSGIGSSIGGASSGTTTTGTGASSSTIGTTSGLAAGFQGATTGTDGTPGGASGSTGSSGSSSGLSGGMGQIIGVATSKSGDSILTPNGQTTYQSWEFWYDPRVELLKKNVNVLGGGGGSSATTFGGNGSSLNGGTGSSGLSGSSGPTSGSGSSGNGSSGTTPQP